ncbi:hypothetical protein CPC08DRAFT_777992, partial [Agrocybe pediades]
MAPRLIHRILRCIHFPDVPPPKAFALGKLNPKPYTLHLLPAPRKFTVKKALRTGPNFFSQVYLGSLDFGNKHRNKARANVGVQQGGLKADDVVLKVYKTSLLPSPAEKSFVKAMARSKTSREWADQWEREYSESEEHMCWTEVFAYSKLAALQGKVKSPGSLEAEESMAIVLQHMKGRPITEVCQKLGSNKDPDLGRWYPIGMEMLRTIYAIHEQGIEGLDIHDGNMLVQEYDTHTASSNDNAHSHPSSSKYSIKVFDFGASSPSEYAIQGGPTSTRASYDAFRMDLLIGEICGV